MQSSKPNVRTAVPAKVLWKWTSVSAFLHIGFITGLCFLSHFEVQRREAAAKAKAATETPAPTENTQVEGAPANQASQPAPATPAASTQPAPATAQAPAPAQPAATPPAAPATPAPEKNTPPSAEKLLGIDKVAKPEETPKGANPFSNKGDDLLKDLK